MKKSFIRKAVPLLVIALLCATNFAFFQVAMAASLTTLSDTATNLTAAQTTSNDIFFKIGTGTLAASGTITLNYATGGSTPTIANTTITSSDIKLYIGGTVGTPGSGTLQTFATITSGVATASGSNWGLTGTSTSETLTAGTSYTGGSFPLASTTVVEIQIGTQAGGTNRITNGSAGTEVVVITTSTGPDTGTVALPIVSNDQVTVTATVNPTISFSLTAGGTGVGGTATSTVGFGVLTSANARYATADSNGTTSTSTPALDVNVGTNAASGYTLTFNAPTNLTDGSHPIPASGVTTIVGSNTGTAGTAQFALSGFAATGTPTITTGYGYTSASATSDWNFATGTPTTLATHSVASSDTVSVRYIANIPATQAPGSYAVTMTYIVTGNF